MFAFASRIWACGIAGCLLLSGCATLPPSPTGPSIAALPAAGMPLHTFDAIEQACRRYARAQTTQHAYDVAYAQCMVSKGAQVPNMAALNAPAPVVSSPPVIVAQPAPVWVWGGYDSYPGWDWGLGWYGDDQDWGDE